MASHQLDQQPSERLVTEILELKRQISELRTLQLTAANGIKVEGVPADPMQIDDIVAPGGLLTFSFQVFPAGGLLADWNFFFTTFVDLPSFPALDVAYRYPAGFNLTAGQKKMRVSSWGDWAKGYDTSGMRWFNVNIENYDSVSHHVYVAGKFYGPYALQENQI